jgi:hypothetical protein
VRVSFQERSQNKWSPKHPSNGTSAVSRWSADKVFLIGQHQSMLDQDPDIEEPISYLFRWDGDYASRPVPMWAASVCVTAHPEPTALFMGIDGTVVRASKAIDFVPESVDDSDEGPHTFGNLRQIRSIGRSVYVCGMGRTVYRSTAGKGWARIDKGVRESDALDSEAGFNTICGFDEKEIYAAGWDGELWRHDGTKWFSTAPLTELALLCSTCASDGKVYIGGQAGLVLMARSDMWQVLNIKGLEQDIFGICCFKQQIYLATSDCLYRLQGSTIVPVDLGKKIKLRAGESFAHLDCTDDVIWSVGPKMAVYSRDGVAWVETAY